MFLLLICSKSLPLAFPFERVCLTHVLQQRFLCGASVLLRSKRRHEEFIEVCCCGLTFPGPFTAFGPFIRALQAHRLAKRLLAAFGALQDCLWPAMLWFYAQLIPLVYVLSTPPASRLLAPSEVNQGVTAVNSVLPPATGTSVLLCRGSCLLPSCPFVPARSRRIGAG